MARKTKKSKEPFKFKPAVNFGAAAAELDTLLGSCFISTAYYDQISDISNPKCGIVGRAGTGKTAILEQLKREKDHYVVLNPEELAFQFLGGSELIRALRKSGVNLDYFYKLLWRHVFVVEILKHFFPEESRRYGKVSQLMERIKGTIRPDRDRDRALQYLDDWGATILQVPQERIRQIHDTFEKRLQADLGVTGPWATVFGLEASAKGEMTWKRDIDERVTIAKKVVNGIQVQELNAVKKYLGTVILDDPEKPCYVLIDDLDRFLGEDPLVYEIIRALLVEIYDWSDVARVKIVFALRDNILHRIEAGFQSRAYQREKLADQRIGLRWTHQELIDLSDRRLSEIAKNMGASDSPRLTDILPKQNSRRPAGVAYILERTLDRPRDVIDFLNKASALAVGKNKISWQYLLQAEGPYSNSRFEALLDEWRENYPDLELVTKLLVSRPPRFPIGDWTEEDILEIMTDTSMSQAGWIDDLTKEYNRDKSHDHGLALRKFRQQVLSILYEVGLVGVRTGAGASDRYSYNSQPVLAPNEIAEDTSVIVHPTFHQALSIGQSN
ncbi:MAG: hypothetical protein Q7K03_02050 [Dehalococcoidia bacterium]|nr:hypothetical protein [Dehalococcoidia bacterium]